jgi:hypothetical protein
MGWDIVGKLYDHDTTARKFETDEYEKRFDVALKRIATTIG